jgi:hypothetical protein
MTSKLGDRLRPLMEEKGISTAQLTEAGGIDGRTMQSILRGDIERPPDRRVPGSYVHANWPKPINKPGLQSSTNTGGT